jgi:hypothetical protein
MRLSEYRRSSIFGEWPRNGPEIEYCDVVSSRAGSSRIGARRTRCAPLRWAHPATLDTARACLPRPLRRHRRSASKSSPVLALLREDADVTRSSALNRLMTIRAARAEAPVTQPGGAYREACRLLDRLVNGADPARIAHGLQEERHSPGHWASAWSVSSRSSSLRPPDGRRADWRAVWRGECQDLIDDTGDAPADDWSSPTPIPTPTTRRPTPRPMSTDADQRRLGSVGVVPTMPPITFTAWTSRWVSRVRSGASAPSPRTACGCGST